MDENPIAQDIVYAMSAAPDSTLLLAAKQSGLQRSDDGGKSWYPITLTPGHDEQPSVTAVALSTGTDGTLHLLAGVPGGVIISRDSGASWMAAALASPPPFVTALALSPGYAQDGMVFASTIEDGMFRSDDWGESWQPWGFGLFDLNVLGLAVSPDFSHDQSLYAVTETGVYCSRNSGRSWQLTDFPAEAAPVLCVAISPAFALDGRLYAGTEAMGLYYSDNRGQAWQRMEQLDIQDSINAILLGAQYPERPEILVVTNHALWYSEDKGESWSDWRNDLEFSDGLTAALAPQGFAAGNLLLLGLANGHILTVI